MSSRGQKAGAVKKSAGLLRWFLLIVVVLLAIGCFNVSSTTAYMNMEEGASSYQTLAKHMGMLVGGLFIMAFVATPFGFSFAKSRTGLLLLSLGTLFLLLLVPLAGQEVNGARRWINLGFFSFQPSELAKIAAILWASQKLASRILSGKESTLVLGAMQKALGMKPEETWGEILTNYGALFLPLVYAGFVLFQPDMGTAVLILMFPVFLYFFSETQETIRRDVVLTVGVATVSLLALAVFEPYRMQRFTAFLYYEQYPEGIGYQTLQSLIAVGSGGLFGQGAGNGLAKFYYLPEQHTDFAFAVWCQEWGFFPAAFVVLLFLALIFVGFKLGARMRDVRGALIVYGCSLLIGVQGILNMAMVLGCFPVTGVPLPFISYGGTALWINLAAVGLIVGAVRENEKKMQAREETLASEAPRRKLSDVAGGTFHIS